MSLKLVQEVSESGKIRFNTQSSFSFMLLAILTMALAKANPNVQDQVSKQNSTSAGWIYFGFRQ